MVEESRDKHAARLDSPFQAILIDENEMRRSVPAFSLSQRQEIIPFGLDLPAAILQLASIL